MRPLAVLTLVIVAIAALIFAYVSIFSGSDRRAIVTGKEVKPAMTEERADVVVVNTTRTEDLPTTREVIEVENSQQPGGWRNRLFGRVTDPAGMPVPKARLSIFGERPPSGLSAIAVMFDPSGKKSKPMRTGRTDENGQYELKGLQPGKDCLLIVDHEKFQRAEVGPITINEEGAIREDVQLQEGFKLFGFVRSHDTGLPIPGAQLWLDNPLSAQLPASRKSPDRMTAVAAEDGSYEFPHVPPGTKWLVCKQEGYGTVVFQNLLLQGSEMFHSQDVRMKLEMIISGRVFGPDRSGIKGATIDAMSYNAETLSRGNAISDADGAFTLRGLADADYSVVARADGWGEKRQVRVRAGAQGLEMELAELGGVRGRVVDSATGKALSNFQVSARMVNLSSTYVGRSVQSKYVRGAENGAFSLSGLSQGHFVIQVSAKDYADTRSERFSVNQGLTVQDVMVRMTRGGTIKGQVLDGYTAKPIPGALVATQDNNWIESPFTNVFKGLVSRTTTEAQARSGTDGRFEFQLLTPGAYQISIQHGDYTSHILNDVQIYEGQAQDLGVIKLFNGAKVTGTAYLADGSRAIGASVSLHPTDGTARSYEVRTNSDGQYTLSNVSPGSYKLSAARQKQDQNPFLVIVDMKQSEIEMTMVDGRDYTQDLYLGSD